MRTLSVIIIARDADNIIEEAMSSVSFAHEVIVIDNGSKDKTLEIAKKMGARVFDYESDSFSDLRNYGLSKATGSWVFYLDTDERVTEELRKSIELAMENYDVTQTGVLKVKRKNYYLGNHEWPFIEKLERLFKKEALKSWKGRLHESPIYQGKIGELDGYLLHHTHSDLTSMVNKTIEWSAYEAELRFSANHPKMTWWRFPRVMLSAFFDSYIRQKGYKAGTVGLIESIYQAFSIFITYARLWELQNRNGK